jgi:2-polyprenyl-3-methyl-5-hydroxy-6-metoxy-1,4-benzoquinol methylase
VSEADREKWDKRYAAGADGAGAGWDCGQPNAFVVDALRVAGIDSGRALDVACGAGCNALYLAAAGFRVDAVDISGVALERAAATARQQNLEVNWIQSDLEAGITVKGGYDLIVMIRYVNADLLSSLNERLNPGGVLVVEQHLRTEADVAGPRNPRFRVAPGTLTRAVEDLTLVSTAEDLVTDSDGCTVALARVVARK